MTSSVLTVLWLSTQAAVASPVTRAGAPLTLREAVGRSTGAGLEVEIAREQVGYSRALVEATGAFLVPSLKLEALFRASSEPDINPYYLFPRDTISTTSASGSAGLAGRFSFGLEYEVSLGGEFATSNRLGTPIDPLYRAPFQVTLTQALLKDRAELQRRELELARVRWSSALIQLKGALLSSALEAGEAYVNLQVAQARVEARVQSRELSRALAQVTAELVQSGRLAGSARIAQEAAISIREQEVLASQVELERARAVLATLLHADPGWAFHASDPLALPTAVPSEAEALVLAETSLPQVRGAAYEVEMARLEAEYQKNQSLPDLSIKASAGSYGQSGLSRCRDGYSVDGVSPCYVPQRITGGPERAVGNTLFGGHGFYGAGVVLTVPLDRGPAQRGLEAAQIALTVRERRLEQEKHAARGRVRESLAVLKGLAAQLQEARRSVKLAGDSLETAKEGYRLGTVTVFDLLKAEELVAETNDRLLTGSQRMALEGLKLEARIGRLAEALLGSDQQRKPTAPP